MPARFLVRRSRNRFVFRRVVAALLCMLLFLTSLSCLVGVHVFASDTRVFSRTLKDADGKRFFVQVRCGADTGIPSDAVLQAEELSNTSASYDVYLERTADILSQDVNYARFFDISLVSPEEPDVQYQPAEGTVVEVRLQLEDAPQNDLCVVHFAEQAPPEVLENTVKGDLLSFETTGFSVYAIVDAPLPEACDQYGFLETDPTRIAGNGFYLAANVANGRSEYWMKSDIVTGTNAGNVISRTPVNDYSGAVRYYFEQAEGADNRFRIYYLDGSDARQYVKLTNNTDAQFVANAATATVFTVTPCADLGSNYPNRFFLAFAGTNGTTYYLNLRKDEAGRGFNGSDYGPAPKTSAGSGIYLYKELDPDDPANLDGKTTALVQQTNNILNTNKVNELTSTLQSDGSLAVREHLLRSNPLDESESVTVDSLDMTQWTFHNVGGSNYYLTTYVDGQLRYLRADEDGNLTLAMNHDEYCNFTYVTGTGNNAGCCSFNFIKAGKPLTEMSLEEMDALWNEAKRFEKNCEKD